MGCLEICMYRIQSFPVLLSISSSFRKPKIYYGLNDLPFEGMCLHMPENIYQQVYKNMCFELRMDFLMVKRNVFLCFMQLNDSIYLNSY